MSYARYLKWLLLIVLIGAAARAFHFDWTIGDDDQRWIIAARGFGKPHNAGLADIYYARIVWRALLAAWGGVFGLSLKTTAVLMFMLSALTTYFIAECGRRAFGTGAGLFAAAVYAGYPLNIHFDVMTLPDGLAVCLLSAALLAFVRSTGDSGGTGRLALAGFLLGLSFSAKEYFPLAFVAFGLAILATREPARWRRIAILAGVGMLGLAADPIMHAVESGDPLAHFSGVTQYQPPPPQDYSEIRRMAGMLATRTDYVRWLLLDYGGIGGWMVLLGLFWLFARWRTSIYARLLAAGAVVLLLFLTFAPARLTPPTLVHAQARYLTGILPFVAIGAGAALSQLLDACRSRELRVAVAALVAVTFLGNLVAANDLPEAYGRREMAGLARAIEQTRADGLNRLVLPFGFDRNAIPDDILHGDVALDIRPPGESVESLLRSDAARSAVYVSLRRLGLSPSRGLPNLAVLGGDREGEFGRLVRSLTDAGRPMQTITAPDTSVRAWADWLGIQAGGQVTGWLFLPNRAPASP